MGAGRDLYERWQHGAPPTVPREDVEKVLDEFFPSRRRRGGKEPMVVEHLWFKALTEWPLGSFTVALVSGRQVKRCYVDDLVFLIGYVEWFRAKGWSEDKPVPRVLGEKYEQEFR